MIISNTTQGSVPYINASNGLAFLAPSSTNAYVLAYNTSTHVPYWKADANTNNKTAQNISTTNNTYPILLGYTANATKNIGNQATLFGSGIKANPSTSTISCSNIETTTINGNTPITSGNISSQSVNYANSAGSCSSAVYTMQTSVEQNSDVNTFAQNNADAYKRSLVYNTSGKEWSYLSSLRSDGAYGAVIKFGYNDGTPTAYIKGKASSSWYSGWRQFMFVGDSVSWSNVTSGTNSNGTMTINGGPLCCNASPNMSNPPLQICYTSSTTATEQTIGLLKFGAPTYDAYLGVAPTTKTYFGKVGYFYHIGTNYEFDWMSSSWKKLMTLECSSGNLWIAGNAYVSSDRHLKKHIQNIDRQSLSDLFDVSDKLLKQFIWKDSGKKSYGFIAQQLEKYIPEAVSQDNEGIKSVSYDIAYAKILASIIDEIKKIKALLQ